MPRAMADDAAKKLARIAKLDDVERQLLEKLRAVADERAAILRGDPTIGQKLKDVYAAWQRAWSERYPGRTYQFNFTKDPTHIKRWLTSGTTVDQLAEMFVRYITGADDDDWLRQAKREARHGFGLFVSTFNKWMPEPEDSDVENFDLTPPGADRRIVGCTHTPPCRTHADCTDRKLLDLEVSPPPQQPRA